MMMRKPEPKTKPKNKTKKSTTLRGKTTVVGSPSDQPKVAAVLGPHPVRNTTRPPMVVAPVLAVLPVQQQLQQQQPSHNNREVATTKYNNISLGCKLAVANRGNREGATLSNNITLTKKPEDLQKKVVAEILRKLQPKDMVVTQDTTPGCVTTSQEGGVKRNCFDTATLVTPSRSSNLSLSNASISTSPGDLPPTAWGLKCKRVKNLKSEHAAL